MESSSIENIKKLDDLDNRNKITVLPLSDSSPLSPRRRVKKNMGFSEALNNLITIPIAPSTAPQVHEVNTKYIKNK